MDRLCEKELGVYLKDILKYNHIGLQVKREYAYFIKKELIKKYDNLKNVSKIIGVSHRTLWDMHKRSIKVYIWKKIFHLLHKDLTSIESYVIKVSNKELYNITFPYKVSPLLIRLVSHIIGDGSYTSHCAVWTQKNVKPIIDLQQNLLGVIGLINKTKNCEQTPIMNFYIKLACAVLNIDRKEMANKHFIEATLNLPTIYKIQVVAAILEDEGSLGKGYIRISMKDIFIIQYLIKLFDSLGYEHGEIKRISNCGFNGKETKNNFIYTIHLNILGVHKFYKDLQFRINKYGHFAGLWKKQDDFDRFIKKYNAKKAFGRELNKSLSLKFIGFIEKNKIVKWKDIKNNFNVSHQRIQSITRRLLNEGKIIQIGRGKYSIL